MRIGKCLAGLAQAADELETRKLGQPQVDHRDVERIFVAGEQAFFAIRGHVDREALLHQLFAQAFTQGRFVLDHQGSHGSAHPSGGGVDTHGDYAAIFGQAV